MKIFKKFGEFLKEEAAAAEPATKPAPAPTKPSKPTKPERPSKPSTPPVRREKPDPAPAKAEEDQLLKMVANQYLSMEEPKKLKTMMRKLTKKKKK